MIEMKGRYTDCKIFTDDIDEMSSKQVQGFIDHVAFENKKVRFMPDIHAGAGSVIGTTAELGDKIIPNVIGVDLNCGVLSVNISNAIIDIEGFDKFVTKNIPSGFNRHNTCLSTNEPLIKDIISTCKSINIDHEHALNSLGSLGGGNHFIELGVDEEESIWITVHSGSRNFGLQIAKYYQAIAKQDCVGLVENGMEYLEGDNYNNYIKDMKVAQQYATENRLIMMDLMISYISGVVIKKIESVHNYINFNDNIIRKGAISAHKGEDVIIPWNMRDGLIIGKGKGNPDWNNSAPHGAGRLFSRSKARKTFSLSEFEKSMEGIYSTSVVESTIDESPMSYKDHKVIEKYLSESVEIVKRVKPIYNFKAK